MYTAAVNLEEMNCGCCGGTYALNARYIQQKREKGGFWNCPYCKESWGYPEDGTEIAKLKKEIERKEQTIARERAAHDQTRASRDAAFRREAAQKAAKTRLKNRVSNGVCPCCQRSFSNLREHMKKQHPAYNPRKKGALPK